MSHYDEYYEADKTKHGYLSTKNDKLSIDDKMGFTMDIKQKTTFSSGAQKEQLGKARFDLIPPEALLSLAEVYSLGTTKYDDRNWEKGIPFSAALGALKRHLNSFELGAMINTADGSHEHMAHVMWWAVALITFIKRDRTDLNDLPHYNELKEE
jgi:hypothetical protein